MPTKLKSFITSKLNILGIVTMLIALSDFISSFQTPEGWTWKSVSMFVIGALVVVIRTYTGQQPITTTAANDLNKKIINSQ